MILPFSAISAIPNIKTTIMGYDKIIYVLITLCVIMNRLCVTWGCTFYMTLDIKHLLALVYVTLPNIKTTILCSLSVTKMK